MATTAVTLNIPTEELPRIEAAICSLFGLEPSAANAKVALRTWVEQTVVRYERRNTEAAAAAKGAEEAAQIKPPTGIE
jgi:hypothetical protein